MRKGEPLRTCGRPGDLVRLREKQNMRGPSLWVRFAIDLVEGRREAGKRETKKKNC